MSRLRGLAIVVTMLCTSSAYAEGFVAGELALKIWRFSSDTQVELSTDITRLPSADCQYSDDACDGLNLKIVGTAMGDYGPNRWLHSSEGRGSIISLAAGFLQKTNGVYRTRLGILPGRELIKLETGLYDSTKRYALGVPGRYLDERDRAAGVAGIEFDAMLNNELTLVTRIAEAPLPTISYDEHDPRNIAGIGIGRIDSDEEYVASIGIEYDDGACSQYSASVANGSMQNIWSTHFDGAQIIPRVPAGLAVTGLFQVCAGDATIAGAVQLQKAYGLNEKLILASLEAKQTWETFLGDMTLFGGLNYASKRLQFHPGTFLGSSLTLGLEFEDELTWGLNASKLIDKIEGEQRRGMTASLYVDLWQKENTFGKFSIQHFENYGALTDSDNATIQFGITF